MEEFEKGEVLEGFNLKEIQGLADA